MNDSLEEVRFGVIEVIGRITEFWGFSRIMGQMYGLLYLSPTPLSLDDVAEELKVSKGNVSINIRALKRWNMVKSVWVKGDRKDYYEAETDFWKIIKGVLSEREQKEFDQALTSVSTHLKKAREILKVRKSVEAQFAVDRLRKLEEFISSMDKLVNVLTLLDDLKRGLFGKGLKK